MKAGYRLKDSLMGVGGENDQDNEDSLNDVDTKEVPRRQSFNESRSKNS